MLRSWCCAFLRASAAAAPSQDDALPVGGRVPLCLHLCLLPLVACAFGRSLEARSLARVSVPCVAGALASGWMTSRGWISIVLHLPCLSQRLPCLRGVLRSLLLVLLGCACTAHARPFCIHFGSWCFLAALAGRASTCPCLLSARRVHACLSAVSNVSASAF